MLTRESIYRIPVVMIAAVLALAVLSGCAGGATPAEETNQTVDVVVPPEIVQQTMPEPSALASADYGLFNRLRTDGPVIPGIFQSAVPQGMAYYADRDLLLISNYMYDGRQSCITVVSATDGSQQKVLWLEEPDGRPHMGHVGGLAVSESHLWIASGPGVFYVDLTALEGTGPLRMTEFLKTAAKGSFATYADGVLWVGEFTSRDGSYTTPRSHYLDTPSGERYMAWMAGFALDEQTDLIGPDHEQRGMFLPDMILSIPHEVQGAVIHGEYVVLSQSYGRKNNSRISIYRNPLGDDPFTNTDLAGVSIPVWVLDRRDRIEVITAPPMTEGIVDFNGLLGVLFESGSDKYRATARDPMDRVQILDPTR